MSNTRYIELDSTYRDRNQYPLPAEFEVQLAQYGSGDRFNAKDPVSKMAPLVIFDGNFDLTGGLVLNGNVDAFGPGVGATSDGLRIVVSSAAGTMNQTENYYTGAVLFNTTTGDRVRIYSFEYLNTSGGLDRGIFTTRTGIAITAGDVITITNPSDNSGPNSHIFIPFGEIFKENFYINLFLIDETIGQGLLITGYDSITSLATLQGVFGGGWAATDSYTIREAVPFETGVLVASTINTVEFPVTFNNTFEYYTGSFIRITGGPAAGQSRRIVSYSDALVPNRVATVFPPFSVVPGLVTFEILTFSHDNYNTIDYSGSIVSQNQSVGYEMELLNLILPNRDLAVYEGNRIVFHPYVELEFSNLSSPNKSVIWSNNPNNKNALFRVPINDIPSPLVSSYVKVDGDGMVQTIKFKPNDTLKFRVSMPNGETFRTIESDLFSPARPNPDLQISAVVAVRRIDP